MSSISAPSSRGLFVLSVRVQVTDGYPVSYAHIGDKTSVNWPPEDNKVAFFLKERLRHTVAQEVEGWTRWSPIMPDGTYIVHIDEWYLPHDVLMNLYHVFERSPLLQQWYVGAHSGLDYDDCGKLRDVDSPDIVHAKATIPALLRLFSFALSRETRTRVFEPAFFEVQSDYVRSRALINNARWQRRLLAIAFSIRALRIVLECVVRDWLYMTWRQFVAFFISMFVVGGLLQWLSRR